MYPEDQAISLLRAEQRGVDVSIEMLTSVFKHARPVHAPNFDPMTRQPQLEDEALTKLDDYRASIEREVKRLLRKRQIEADEFRGKL